MPVDPATKLILDFISVMESNGNYNAVIGNADATNDLSALTIPEIYAEQDALVQSGMPSSAIGRYQFIEPTLKSLIQMKRIPPTTLFTPDLQDELAVQLMVGRGYSKWWLKKMSDKDFAHGLSCEWASLPDPYNGDRSHYDGDAAGNHAGRTMDQVYVMLGQARILVV